MNLHGEELETGALGQIDSTQQKFIRALNHLQFYFQNMERSDVLEAYGLMDLKKVSEQKCDSKVTEAEEQQLSNQFYSSLQNPDLIFATLCGKELTIKHLNTQEAFNIGFWSTFEPIQRDKVMVGFRLLINDTHSYEFYSSEPLILVQWKNQLEKVMILHGFYEDYKPTVKIGKGKSASVFLAKRRLDNEKVAIKAFAKNQLQKNQRDLQGFQNEVNILRNMDHKNIINIYALYETEKSYYMVLQYVQGKNLKEFIEQQPIPYKTCLDIMQKLASGLRYLANKDIAHRDLKPENIVITESLNPIIVDFGLATECKKGDYIYKHCGTPGFVAPQILQAKCEVTTPKADIFSLGIVFHLLIFKNFPYSAKDYNSLLDQNRKAHFNFHGPRYQMCPQEGLALMEAMVKANPEERISARQICKKLALMDMARDSQRGGSRASKKPLARRSCSTKSSNSTQGRVGYRF